MVGVLWVDADGVVQQANDAALEMLGGCVGRACCHVVSARGANGQKICGNDCAGEIAKGSGDGVERGAVTIRGRMGRIECSRMGQGTGVVLIPGPSKSVERLTPREIDVMGLVAEGLTSRKIALRLGIQPATVRTHMEHAREKLGARTRAGAVATALATGII